MHHRYLTFIAIAICNLPRLAVAQSSPETITEYGLQNDNGPFSCGKFISESTEPLSSNHWKSWISGYISGLNEARSRYTGNVDMDGMYLWMQNYCKDHPLDLLANSFHELDRKLGAGRHPIYDDKFLKK